MNTEKPIDLGASEDRGDVSSDSGDDGTVRVTAVQLEKMKMAKKAAWWSSFTVYEGQGGHGMVRCNHCAKSFSGRNVARSAKTHFNMCKPLQTCSVGQTRSFGFDLVPGPKFSRKSYATFRRVSACISVF